MTTSHCRQAVLLLAFTFLQGNASAKWWNILKESKVKREVRLPDEKEMDETPATTSFGVDVSFPMHYKNLSRYERPFGDSKRVLYEEFMQGCRDYFGENGWACDDHEEKRISLNLYQPRALENYTDTGFKKLRLSPELFSKIKAFWEANKGAEVEESWSLGNILVNYWDSPTYMLSMWDTDLEHGGQEILDAIQEEVQSKLEKWTGQHLSHTSTYGVRIYKEGSILSPHVDRDGLVSSAIINVDQDVDEPWMLEVIDRQGKSQNITMDPGDLVLYESHTLIHGRTYPLRGRYYANIFVHFDADGPLNESNKSPQIQDDNDEMTALSFGVDVSFPHHHKELKKGPLGDSKQTLYEEYMQGCRDYSGNEAWMCDEHDEKRLSLNLNQPPKLQNYTDTGFKKIKLSRSVWRKIQYFWEANQGAEYEEEWGAGNVLANYWDSPTFMLDVFDENLWNGGHDLLEAIRAESQSTLEEWTGQRLQHTSTYGVRIYKQGSILSPHVDRDGLVSSAIINVAQDVDEPWPLEVIDRNGMSQNITMEPGEMVLYESHTLIHGRTYPLNGRFMANIFVHFDAMGSLDEQVCKGGTYTNGSCDDTEGSYGVDVSFKHQHHELRSGPFGNDKQELYDEFMQGCRDYYEDEGHRCDSVEYDRILQNFEQPASLQNFTDAGFKKIRAPPELWDKLDSFFNANHGDEYEEDWPAGDIHTNHWKSPTYMLSLGDYELEGGGDELKESIWEAARPILEEWSGQKLEATHLYGVRIYKEGSILNPHVDREGLVISAIVNVAQDVDEPWMLEVIDRQGKAQNITMEPGDMVLYESRTLIHGRPFPLKGRFYANVFIHFEPIGYMEEEESDSEDEWDESEDECPVFDVEYASIEQYLNPKLFEDPETLAAIGEKLRQGDLVVIEDAFLPEFAEAMYCDLNHLTAWQQHEGYQDDGFAYKHHNIYNPDDFSDMITATRAVFEHPESKKFIAELSGRDCYGDSTGSEGSASYYMPGDYSLPHTDHIKQRTVAYVWHLTKNWDPSWGGALYWGLEHINNSFINASFNTLFLFSVRSTTSHFVTTVSPHAAEKRLAFNGWWQSSWLPSPNDNLEEMLATPEQRRDLTEYQVGALEDIIYEESDLEPNRREGLEALLDVINEELWPTEPETVSYVSL